MPAPKVVRSHSFRDVVLTIAGVTISGYAESGGVEFEFGADISESVAGALGEHFVSDLNDDRVIATITVMQNSFGASYLGELLNAQQAARGAKPVFPFYLRNFRTGEIVEDSQAYFQARPAPNQGREMSEREFVMMLPFAAGSIKYGDAG